MEQCSIFQSKWPLPASSIPFSLSLSLSSSAVGSLAGILRQALRTPHSRPGLALATRFERCSDERRPDQVPIVLFAGPVPCALLQPVPFRGFLFISGEGSRCFGDRCSGTSSLGFAPARSLPERRLAYVFCCAPCIRASGRPSGRLTSAILDLLYFTYL